MKSRHWNDSRQECAAVRLPREHWLPRLRRRRYHACHQVGTKFAVGFREDKACRERTVTVPRSATVASKSATVSCLTKGNQQKCSFGFKHVVTRFQLVYCPTKPSRSIAIRRWCSLCLCPSSSWRMTARD